LPLVLLHGQPGARSDWDAVVRALPAWLPSLALDRPGYRTNPLPAGTFDANARWLIGELDRAGIAEAILVAHSYAGGVAIAATVAHPERVRGLVLVASIGPGCLDGWDMLLAAPIAGPVCAIAAWWLTPRLARTGLSGLERLRGRRIGPQEFLNWETWANAGHAHGAMWRTFLIEQRQLVRGLEDLTRLLGRVTAATLVLADPADKMIPIDTAVALAAGIPDAKLTLTGRGGHNLPRRVPDVLAAEITRFARELQVP
jgi:pimeloyl-ACP methyl ester carboxylesterase